MLTHDADKCMMKRWSSLPWKFGMPLNAWGFNSALAQIGHFKRFMSLDATAFDSTIPSDIYHKVIARLEARGFAQHVVAERIEAALQASYTAVQQGYLFDTLTGAVFHYSCLGPRTATV